VGASEQLEEACPRQTRHVADGSNSFMTSVYTSAVVVAVTVVVLVLAVVVVVGIVLLSSFSAAFYFWKIYICAMTKDMCICNLPGQSDRSSVRQLPAGRGLPKANQTETEQLFV